MFLLFCSHPLPLPAVRRCSFSGPFPPSSSFLSFRAQISRQNPLFEGRGTKALFDGNKSGQAKGAEAKEEEEEEPTRMDGMEKMGRKNARKNRGN
jgi:hypothetical protein